MHIRCFSIFACMLALSLVALCVEARTVTILLDDGAARKEGARQLLPRACTIASFTYDVDIPFDGDELAYLLGIVPKLPYNAATLSAGLYRLSCKHLFRTISLKRTGTPEACHLHAVLEASWRVCRVDIRGFWFRGAVYKQYYLMQPGDYFDPAEHYYGVRAVQDACIHDGYYNAVVIPTIKRNDREKTVSVRLDVRPGERFVCGRQQLFLTDQKGTDTPQELHQLLMNRFFSRLVGKRCTQETLATVARIVKQYLEKRGYLEIHIGTTQRLVRDEGTVHIDWHITARHQKSFVFFGNRFFSATQLLDRIFLFGHSVWLVPPSILAQELADFYRSEGFLQVSVTPEEEEERVFFIVKEGVRFHIDEVEIVGVDEQLQEELERLFFQPLLHNAYRRQQVQLAIDRAMHHCVQQGYGSATATHVVDDQKEGGAITITVTLGAPSVPPFLESKPQNYFGKTVLCGATRLPFSIIKRELVYKEGDVWDAALLQQTVERLQTLNIFEGVTCIPAYESNTHYQTVLLKLHDDAPFEFRLRAGIELQQMRRYRTAGGLAGNIGSTFMVKNPTNKADLLRADFDVAPSHRELVFRYGWPTEWGVPLRCALQGYVIRHDQPGLVGDKRYIYATAQDGFLIEFGKKMVHWDAAVTVGVEVASVSMNMRSARTRYQAQQLAAAINFEPVLLDRRVPMFFIEPTLFMNYLDDELYPAKGVRSMISLKGAFPARTAMHEAQFTRILVEQSLFIPFKQLVGAFRFRVGHLFHQSFSAIMPTDRFYLGGVHSFRGYETDGAPPLGCFEDAQGKKQYVPRGGKSMVNLNVELRTAMWKNWGGALFHDIGLLTADRFSMRCSSGVLQASGFGIWYHTPLGPLRFDLAFKWHRAHAQEQRYAWFLTLGHPF